MPILNVVADLPAPAGPRRYDGQAQADAESQKNKGQGTRDNCAGGHCGPRHSGNRRLAGICSRLNNDCIDHGALPTLRHCLYCRINGQEAQKFRKVAGLSA